METLKFKTNINCGACVEKVTPVLNSRADIQKWAVDTAVPDKILSVETEGLDEEDFLSALKKVGYRAERV